MATFRQHNEEWLPGSGRGRWWLIAVPTLIAIAVLVALVVIYGGGSGGGSGY